MVRPAWECGRGDVVLPGRQVWCPARAPAPDFTGLPGSALGLAVPASTAWAGAVPGLVFSRGRSDASLCFALWVLNHIWMLHLECQFPGHCVPAVASGGGFVHTLSKASRGCGAHSSPRQPPVAGQNALGSGSWIPRRPQRPLSSSHGLAPLSAGEP